MLTKPTKVKIMVGSLVVTAMSTGAVAAMASQPESAADCGAFSGKIVESAVFTPYEDRRSHLPDGHLNPAGGKEIAIPSELSVDAFHGEQRQWTVSVADGSVYQYFGDRPIDGGASLWGFEASGGIQLEATPRKSAGISLQGLADFLGERAVPVSVGGYDGLVVWADPDSPDGPRLHNVYWEDGDTSWALIADMSAEEAVTAAREVACR